MKEYIILRCHKSETLVSDMNTAELKVLPIDELQSMANKNNVRLTNENILKRHQEDLQEIEKLVMRIAS